MRTTASASSARSSLRRPATRWRPETDRLWTERHAPSHADRRARRAAGRARPPNRRTDAGDGGGRRRGRGPGGLGPAPVGHRAQGARPRAVRHPARRTRRSPRSHWPPVDSRAIRENGCAGCRASPPSTADGLPRSLQMRSSRWDAQGNIYLVTEEPQTAESVRAAVGDADGVLEVLGHGDDCGRDHDLESRRIAGGDVRQRHADRRAVARGADGRDRDHRARRAARGRCAPAARRPGRAGSRRGRRLGSRRRSTASASSPSTSGTRMRSSTATRATCCRSGRCSRRTSVSRSGRTFRSRACVGGGVIEARVWERGAGETASSGSSAVAVAAAFGVSPAVIRFPGGELHVRFEGARAFLTGPAVRV